VASSLSSRASRMRAASAVACARLRLNLATPSAGMDRCTGTRGWEGGRSSDGLGMTGVCPWQYWFCSPHQAHCWRSEGVAKPLELAHCQFVVVVAAPRVASDRAVAPGSKLGLA
jgi:hypothetical protein